MLKFPCLVVGYQEKVVSQICDMLAKEFMHELRVRSQLLQNANIGAVISSELIVPNILVYQFHPSFCNNPWKTVKDLSDAFTSRVSVNYHIILIGSDDVGEDGIMGRGFDMDWVSCITLTIKYPMWIEAIREQLKKNVIPHLIASN